MRRFTLLVALIACAPAFAQQWSGILAPARASSSWPQAGAGTIPNRTTVCATLGAGSTAAQINSAIASCPAGQVVQLSAGTYSIGSPGIIFNAKNDVTLRGAGANSTILNFSASNNCGGMGADVCFINGDPNSVDDISNSANWTGGYTQGSTQLTLSATNNLKVGTVIILDQLNDSDTDNGGVWVCGKGNVCATEGQSGIGRSGPRQQIQLVRVTAISGNNVSITPGIRMPNWRSDRSPQAWWSSSLPVTGSGVEDVQLNHTSSGGKSGIYFYNAYNCWAKGVASIKGPRNHVWLYQSAHVTVRDSYFFDTKGQESESYGVEHFMASDNLIENNIFQHIAAAMLSDGGSGSVFGYNFSINDFYDVDGWAQGSAYLHGPGNSYFLWEGNDGFGLIADNVHGTAHFITAFRNRFQGWEQGKSMQTVPVHIYAANRFFNIIGNVLGDVSYHTVYSAQAGGSSANCDNGIYSIGWGGNCGSGNGLPNDPLAVSTLLRWGNYDTVNDASRFMSSEVPSGSSLYPNPVPSSQSLPSSFYLTSKPAFFGSVAWPAIGPDVTGGSETGVGGHNVKIPARRCFEDVMMGAFSNTTARTFNAASCYSGAPQVRPKPPAVTTG